MKTNTNISLDSELKKEAVWLFKEFGLDLSTAITLCLSQSVREQKIPFEIKCEAPNKVTLDAYKEVEDMEKNPNKYPSFNSVDSLMDDLLKWNMRLKEPQDLKMILSWCLKEGLILKNSRYINITC